MLTSVSLQFIRQSNKPQHNLFTELGSATCSEAYQKQGEQLGAQQTSQPLSQQKKQRKRKILITLSGSFISLEHYKKTKEKRDTLFKPNEERDSYQPNWQPTFTNCLQEM